MSNTKIWSGTIFIGLETLACVKFLAGTLTGKHSWTRIRMATRRYHSLQQRSFLLNESDKKSTRANCPEYIVHTSNIYILAIGPALPWRVNGGNSLCRTWKRCAILRLEGNLPRIITRSINSILPPCRKACNTLPICDVDVANLSNKSIPISALKNP